MAWDLVGAYPTVAGCGNAARDEQAGSDELVACDPFRATSVPTRLGAVIAVGQDESGTVYVLDRDENSELRVFASSGDTLVRKEVTGSGEGPGWYVVSVSNPTFKLKVEGSGGDLRIGILHGDCQCKDFEIASADEVLETLPPEAAAAFRVQNLSNEIVGEFWLTVDDGRRLLVSRARYDWDDSVRLFLGPPEAISEHRVESFSRDWTTYITFVAGNTTEDVYIPATEMGVSWESAYVTQGATELALAPEETPPGAGNVFLCFS